MTKRISELPAATSLADTDEFELNQSGASRKATRAQIVAGLASAEHLHTLADITDSGALAALDGVGLAQIEAAAFASQSEAAAGTDNAKLMTPLRTAEAIAAQPIAGHEHALADIIDAGALAGLDLVGAGEIAPNAVTSGKISTGAVTADKLAADAVTTAKIAPTAYASQAEAVDGTDNGKLMTPLSTAEAIATRPPAAHQHNVTEIAGVGTLAALDLVGAAEIAPTAYASQAEAVAGTDNDKLMTPLRTAEAIAAQPPAPHQHNVTELADVGALAGLDVVDTAEIAPNAYASQAEAVGGTDNAKLMTPLRTAEAIAAQGLPAHQHELADITGAGTLAGLDEVGTAEIAQGAYASQAEAVAGTDNAKLMTPLRTAEAIAAQPFAAHEHVLADITDAGTLARLDVVGTAEIAPDAYASQAETLAGTDNAKLMTPLRAAEAIATHPPAVHEHALADITGVGTLATLNLVGPGEIAPDAVTSGKISVGAVTADKLAADAVTSDKIAPTAYSSQAEAVAGVNDDKLMTPLRTAEAIAARPIAAHEHALADISDAGSLAGLDVVGTGQIAPAAYASQPEAVAGTDNDKLMTPLRTAQAIAAQPIGAHEHVLADITDAGNLAGLDLVGAGDIAPNAVTTGKILSGAVTHDKLADNAVIRSKIAAGAVGPGQLEDTGVVPGLYTKADIIVDQQGRITAASSGTTDGEANTGSNIGTHGVGVFDGKAGVELRFRNVAAASERISVALSGADIELDVVDNHLAPLAENVAGLAVVATTGTLASLSNLDAGGGAFTNHLNAQDTVSGAHTFVQSDSGREKIFTGSTAATWIVPVLAAGTHTIVHNLGTAEVTFSSGGVSLTGSTTLPANRTAALSWLPGNIVKLTGELV